MKCIVLYITKSIRGVITDLDTAKCKYFKILVVIKVLKNRYLYSMGLVGEYCTGRLFFAIRVIVSTEEPNEMKNMDENVIECDHDRQLQLKFV